MRKCGVGAIRSITPPNYSDFVKNVCEVLFFIYDFMIMRCLKCESFLGFPNVNSS